jgi:hypothetical protein
VTPAGRIPATRRWPSAGWTGPGHRIIEGDHREVEGLQTSAAAFHAE